MHSCTLDNILSAIMVECQINPALSNWWGMSDAESALRTLLYLFKNDDFEGGLLLISINTICVLKCMLKEVYCTECASFITDNKLQLNNEYCS